VLLFGVKKVGFSDDDVTTMLEQAFG